MALAHLITRHKFLCTWFPPKRPAAADAVHINHVRSFNIEAGAIFDL